MVDPPLRERRDRQSATLLTKQIDTARKTKPYFGVRRAANGRCREVTLRQLGRQVYSTK